MAGKTTGAVGAECCLRLSYFIGENTHSHHAPHGDLAQFDRLNRGFSLGLPQ